MRKLIGFTIDVYLKGQAEPLVGLLIDVDEGEIYMREHAENFRVIVVPRVNVNYCVMDDMPTVSRVMPEEPSTVPQPPPSPPKPNPVVGLGVQVFVGGTMVEEIPTPPTFNLNEWHDDILRVAMGNPGVKSSLLGMVQRSMEYFPPKQNNGFGQLHIEVDIDENAPTQQLPQKPGSADSTFSMSGSPTTGYLNPSQMVARLNNVNKGDKNE